MELIKDKSKIRWNRTGKFITDPIHYGWIIKYFLACHPNIGGVRTQKVASE